MSDVDGIKDQFEQMIRDPVVFCKLTGILHPHFYQEEILNVWNFSGRQILVNTSRQVGKCGLPTTKLQLSDGSLVMYKDLTDESVMMYTGDGFRPSEPIKVIDNGVKECLKVTTRSGRVIKCTTNHPFLTQFGYVNAEDLTKEHRLAMAREVNIEGKEILTDNEVAFIGYMIADGTIVNRRRFAFFNSDKDIVEGFTSTIKSYSIMKHDERCPRYTVNGNEKRELIEKLGLMGTKSGDKFIPKAIFQSTTRQIAIFLSKLIDCDGYVYQQPNDAVYIEYCSKSQQLIEDIGYLATRLGMYGKIFSKYNKKVDTTYHYISFTSSIAITNAKKHFQLCPRKQEVLDRASPQGHDHIDTFPFSKQIKQQIRDNSEKVINYNKLWGFELHNYYAISPEKVHIINDKSPQYSLDASIFWDYIESIEPIGKHPTMGIEVPEYHNHITNGFVTHNTTTCAALAIWWALTRPLLPASEGGQKDHLVTLTAPSKGHAEKLFSPMISMVKRSEFLSSLLIRDTRTEIEFKVGGYIGKIKCLTAGEKGDQIRGDPNDLIIFDEAAMVDYAKEEMIFNQAIIPSMAHTRGVLYLISTPKGRSNFFGRTALECQIGEAPKWKYIEVPCWDATKAIIKGRGISQLDEEYLIEEKKRIGDIAFAQEYECKLIDVGISFFDWELIQSCTVPIPDNINDVKLKLPESEIYFGIDVARSVDKTVIVVVEKFKEPYGNSILTGYLDKRLKPEDREKYKNLPKVFVRYIHVIDEPLKFFAGEGDGYDQETVIRELYKVWKPNKIFIDETGLGKGIYEYLARQRYPIEGITFSQQKKKEMFDILKSLMRTGRIAFSKKNIELHNQLNGITVEKTVAGTEVLRHSTKFDDIACALALATECTRTLGSEILLDFVDAPFNPNVPTTPRGWRQKQKEVKPQWDW